MLASRKPIRSSNLNTGIFKSTKDISQSSKNLPYANRAFSWGAKSRWGFPHAGKVYRGFYTRQADAQLRKRKRCPTLSGLDRSYLGLDRLRSRLGWRSASLLKGPNEQPPDKIDRCQRDEGEDWYDRWERQKIRQYDEFVRIVEQDPYRALFGASNRLLGWLDQAMPASKSPEPAPKSSQAERPSNEIKETSQTNIPVKTWPYVRKFRSGDSDGTKSGVIEEREYEIDPITLRKVPKVAPKSDVGLRSPSITREDIVGIPVEKFNPSASDSKPKVSSTIPSFQAETAPNQQDWLSQEGFRTEESQIKTHGIEKHRRIAASSKSSKIESALDRHIQHNKLRSTKSENAAVNYGVNEAQEDDVDLLRASDVRASMGLRGRIAKEEVSAKQSRQKILEDSFERRPSEMDDLIAEEVASSKSKPAFNNPKAPPYANILADPDSHSSTNSSPKVPASTSSTLTSGQVGRIRAKLVPLKTRIDMLKEDYAGLRKQLLNEKHRLEETAKKKAARKAKEILDQEIEAQQAAMNAIEIDRSKDSQLHQSMSTIPHEESHGEGDMASNVHEFAGRDRWYKRKAPHAECEMDAKLKRIANEKAFVQEIRDIYEDTYGNINIEHRQPSTFREEVAATKSAEAELREVGSERSGVQSWDQWLEHGPHDILSIRKEIAKELDSLAFNISTCQERASLEPHPRTKELVIKEGIGSALQSFNKLLSTVLQLVRSYDPRNVYELRRSLRAALASAGIDLASDFSRPKSEPNSNTEIRSTDVKQMEGLPSDSGSPIHYRILAYDNTLQKVSSAKTSSQTPFVGEEPLTPLQALNQLQNPGKFLPHLVSLHNKGYDIISGANDIVILKKVRDAVISKDDYFGRPNPIDGTTTPEVSTGNFASPTGFVNHNPVIPPEEDEAQRSAPLRPVDKVRREEDVFSGSTRRNWQESRRIGRKDRRRVRRHKTFKRMLLTGLVTAAACYTTGVVIEMMHM